MVATVVYWELRFAGRRRRQHFLRWLYAAWLVLLLLIAFVSQPRVRFATTFVEQVVVQQLIILLLFMPALAAGTVTEERARGTLPQLVTTDLWPGDILLGKLLARLAEMGLLLLTSLPILALIGVFGGLYPVLMLMVLWVGVPLLFALGSAGMLASVLARQTRDAVVGVYLFGIVAGLVIWQFFPSLARALNPLEVLRPALERGQLRESALRLLLYSLAWLGLGAVCLLAALVRFPRVWQRPFEQAGSRRTLTGRDGAALAVGDPPIPWKEHRIHGLTPLPGLQNLPAFVSVLLVGLLSATAAAAILWWAQPPPFGGAGKAIRRVHVLFPVHADKAEQGFFLLASAGLLAASLVVGVRASAAVSGEREAGTWDALLVTPLEPHHLLRGKLNGILRAAVPYLVAFALPMLGLSILGGPPSFFWALLVLAVTPLAMYYLGAAGIYSSVTCPNSTRSLVWTLGYGYIGAGAIYIMASFLTAILTGIVHMFLVALTEHYDIKLRLGGHGELAASVLIGSCLTMALAFYLAAHYLLKQAEHSLADRERIRQEEPARRQRRPRLPQLDYR